MAIKIKSVGDNTVDVSTFKTFRPDVLNSVVDKSEAAGQ